MVTTALRTDIADRLSAMRARSPLVHGIVGSVTRSFVADGLLAAGARPMLTETLDEAPTLVSVADALLVNLGSLSTDGRDGCLPTARAAGARPIPWVLDPTAIGLAPARTPLAHDLLGTGPTVVRGNASEVLTLAGGGPGGRGADSVAGPDEAGQAARSLASEHGCVVAVSGPVDLITDGDGVVRVAGGRPVLTRVTGTGCLLGALTTALVATTGGLRQERGTPFAATVAATALLTVAANRAGDLGPGSFRVALLDALAALTPEDVAQEVELWTP